jgi:hypothetical protein
MLPTNPSSSDALRGALVAIADAHGELLRSAVSSRIANGIITREGLWAHVSAWAADPTSSDKDRKEAQDLLQAIEAARERTSGKPEGLAGNATPTSPDDIARLKLVALDDLSIGGIAPALTGKLEEVYLALDADLAIHPDYKGQVRRDVRILLNYLILYLVHCLDVTPRMAEGQFTFLLDRGGAKPLEVELQKSLWTYLRLQANGFPPHQVLREVHDVGSGRADIAIARPDWRAVIEIKRELDDPSRDGIRKYLGQAATYELTGPRIGFLVVLDLCSQKEWPLTLQDNCWIEAVAGSGDSQPRLVVVWRIPGMRRAPSDTRTLGIKSESGS